MKHMKKVSFHDTPFSVIDMCVMGDNGRNISYHGL